MSRRVVGPQRLKGGVVRGAEDFRKFARAWRVVAPSWAAFDHLVNITSIIRLKRNSPENGPVEIPRAVWPRIRGESPNRSRRIPNLPICQSSNTWIVPRLSSSGLRRQAPGRPPRPACWPGGVPARTSGCEWSRKMQRAYWAGVPGRQTGWQPPESRQPQPWDWCPRAAPSASRTSCAGVPRLRPLGLPDHQPAVRRCRKAHAAAETLRQPLCRRAAEVEPEIQVLEVEPEPQGPQFRIPMFPAGHGAGRCIGLDDARRQPFEIAGGPPVENRVQESDWGRRPTPARRSC